MNALPLKAFSDKPVYALKLGKNQFSSYPFREDLSLK